MSRAEGGKRKRLTGVLRMERVPLVNCIELQMRWVIVAEYAPILAVRDEVYLNSIRPYLNISIAIPELGAGQNALDAFASKWLHYVLYLRINISFVDDCLVALIVALHEAKRGSAGVLT